MADTETESTDSIATLISTYHSLNAAIVDVLYEEPSPLEFMRYVASNRPFVVRGGANHWKAVQEWDAEYLMNAMKGQNVEVAVTPKGNADAIVENENGQRVYVEPHKTTEIFEDFMTSVRQGAQSGNVKYAQTQNDNLRDEYTPLQPDVPTDIPFARIALSQSADAINVWIGNDRSITSLHKDNYENIYVQVRGEKHFVLLPPCEMPCVNEQPILRGRYAPPLSDPEGELVVEVDERGEMVPVATWDPDFPEEHTTAYSHLAQPLRVTLKEGDMLYLPAMYYHKVMQSCGDEGYCCAVNYWYDMDFAGGFWAHNAFVRDVTNAAQNTKVNYPDLDLKKEEC